MTTISDDIIFFLSKANDNPPDNRVPDENNSGLARKLGLRARSNGSTSVRLARVRRERVVTPPPRSGNACARGLASPRRPSCREGTDATHKNRTQPRDLPSSSVRSASSDRSYAARRLRIVYINCIHLIFFQTIFSFVVCAVTFFFFVLEPSLLLLFFFFHTDFVVFDRFRPLRQKTRRAPTHVEI